MNSKPKETEVTWSLAMMSAPRAVDYLSDSLRSVAAAGWDDCAVSADGAERLGEGRTQWAAKLFSGASPGMPPLPASVPLYFQSKKLGPLANLIACLRIAMERVKSDDTLLLILQDDIELTANLRPLCLDTIIGNLDHFRPTADHWRNAITSLYICAGNVDLLEIDLSRDAHEPPQDDSFARLPFKGVVRNGPLATVWPQKIARQFLADHPSPLYATGEDLILARWLRSKSIDYFAPVVSFVKHTGEVTSLDEEIGVPVYRQCGKFAKRLNPNGTIEYEQVFKARPTGVAAR